MPYLPPKPAMIGREVKIKTDEDEYIGVVIGENTYSWFVQVCPAWEPIPRLGRVSEWNGFWVANVLKEDLEHTSDK